MDKKYHRGNGEVVKVIGDFVHPSLKYFIDLISESPIYAYCNPKNPVGWIEGEEVYQVQNAGATYWGDCFPFEWSTANTNVKRIWIEPTRGITINDGKGFVSEQPNYEQEAQELYPLHDVFSKDERAAHIKARQMSEQEIRELRERVRKLREGLGQIIFPQHFIINFPNKEWQSKYNEALRNAKQLLKETEG